MQRKDLSEKAFQGKYTQEKQKLEECARESFSGVKDFDKDSIIRYEYLQKLVKIIKKKPRIDIFYFLNKLGMGRKQLCTLKTFYGLKKQRPVVDTSTFVSTCTLNDAFTVNGMFIIIFSFIPTDIFFSFIPTDIFIIAGRSTIADTSTHGDVFIITGSLTLDDVSMVFCTLHS